MKNEIVAICPDCELVYSLKTDRIPNQISSHPCSHEFQEWHWITFNGKKNPGCYYNENEEYTGD